MSRCCFSVLCKRMLILAYFLLSLSEAKLSLHSYSEKIELDPSGLETPQKMVLKDQEQDSVSGEQWPFTVSLLLLLALGQDEKHQGWAQAFPPPS